MSRRTVLAIDTCVRRYASPLPHARFLSTSLQAGAASDTTSSSTSPPIDPPPSPLTRRARKPNPMGAAQRTLKDVLAQNNLPDPGPAPSASDYAANARFILGPSDANEFIRDVEQNPDNILHSGNLIPPRQAYTLPVTTEVGEMPKVDGGADGRTAVSVVGGVGIPPRKDPLVDLMTNLMMKHGRKAEAERRMSDILALIQRSTSSPPLPFLHRAIQLTSPLIRIRTLRRSSKNLPLPTPLDARQSARTAILWILKAAERGRAGGLTRRSGRIAREVLGVCEWGVSDGLSGGSDAVKRLEEVHKMGAVNRSNLNVTRG